MDELVENFKEVLENQSGNTAINNLNKMINGNRKIKIVLCKLILQKKADVHAYLKSCNSIDNQLTLFGLIFRVLPHNVAIKSKFFDEYSADFIAIQATSFGNDSKRFLCKYNMTGSNVLGFALGSVKYKKHMNCLNSYGFINLNDLKLFCKDGIISHSYANILRIEREGDLFIASCSNGEDLRFEIIAQLEYTSTIEKVLIARGSQAADKRHMPDNFSCSEKASLPILDLKLTSMHEDPLSMNKQSEAVVEISKNLTLTLQTGLSESVEIPRFFKTNLDKPEKKDVLQATVGQECKGKTLQHNMEEKNSSKNTKVNVEKKSRKKVLPSTIKRRSKLENKTLGTVRKDSKTQVVNKPLTSVARAESKYLNEIFNMSDNVKPTLEVVQEIEVKQSRSEELVNLVPSVSDDNLCADIGNNKKAQLDVDSHESNAVAGMGKKMQSCLSDRNKKRHGDLNDDMIEEANKPHTTTSDEMKPQNKNIKSLKGIVKLSAFSTPANSSKIKPLSPTKEDRPVDSPEKYTLKSLSTSSSNDSNALSLANLSKDIYDTTEVSLPSSTELSPSYKKKSVSKKRVLLHDEKKSSSLSLHSKFNCSSSLSSVSEIESGYVNKSCRAKKRKLPLINGLTGDTKVIVKKFILSTEQLLKKQCEYEIEKVRRHCFQVLKQISKFKNWTLPSYIKLA